VDFNLANHLGNSFKYVTGVPPTEESGYVSFAVGTSSIWYTTNPDGTSTIQPYEFPADSLFAHGGRAFRVSLDFLVSSMTEGKLVVPGLYLFNPAYTGENSGVIATFTTSNDKASSPASIALRCIEDPTASSLGSVLVSSNPSNGALKREPDKNQWLRLELLFIPITSTSASFTLNLYSIPTNDHTAPELLGTISSSAINYGYTASTLDFSAETKFAVGIRNYVDTGSNLYIDNLRTEPVL